MNAGFSGKLLDTSGTFSEGIYVHRCIFFRPSHFFLFRLASNVFPDIGRVGRSVGLKKKKQLTRSLGIGCPGTTG